MVINRGPKSISLTKSKKLKSFKAFFIWTNDIVLYRPAGEGNRGIQLTGLTGSVGLDKFTRYPVGSHLSTPRESERAQVVLKSPRYYGRLTMNVSNVGPATPGNNRARRNAEFRCSGKSDEGGYYKTYGSDAEGEKGYLKATFSKGNHGYKNLDTFHKQDGDKYAFEKHIAYGKAQADKKSGHNVAAASRSSKGGDYEGAGTIVDSHYTADEGDHGDHSGEHVEGDHSGYSEGAHYTDHGPESSSYGHSEGYATKDGDHGSYESHSSYSRDYGDEQGDQGGHYY